MIRLDSVTIQKVQDAIDFLNKSIKDPGISETVYYELKSELNGMTEMAILLNITSLFRWE